jgi:hypothetical protein
LETYGTDTSLLLHRHFLNVGSSGVTLSTNNPLNGTTSLRYNDLVGVSHRTSIAADPCSESVTGFSFRVAVLPQADERCCLLDLRSAALPLANRTAAKSDIQLFLRPDGSLQLFVSGTLAETTSTPVIRAGQYYAIAASGLMDVTNLGTTPPTSTVTWEVSVLLDGVNIFKNAMYTGHADGGSEQDIGVVPLTEGSGVGAIYVDNVYKLPREKLNAVIDGENLLDAIDEFDMRLLRVFYKTAVQEWSFAGYDTYTSINEIPTDDTDYIFSNDGQSPTSFAGFSLTDIAEETYSNALVVQVTAQYDGTRPFINLETLTDYNLYPFAAADQNTMTTGPINWMVGRQYFQSDGITPYALDDMNNLNIVFEGA